MTLQAMSESNRWLLAGLLLAAICCVSQVDAGIRCGLVDGFVDGSTDSDADSDGIPDCLDAYPQDPGVTCDLVVDSFADEDDGECLADCTLREALEIAAGSGCTIRLGPGIHRIELGGLLVESRISIVGAGAYSTIIDAEVDGPAITAHQGSSLLLAGLALEYDDSGISHVSGDAVHLSNSILRGDPADAAGVGLDSGGESAFTDTTSGRLNNTIVRGGSPGLRAQRGARLYLDACLLTENRGNSLYLGFGYNYRTRAILRDCEVSFNDDGIYVDGVQAGPSVGTAAELTLERTLVKRNSATQGAGVYVSSGWFGGGNATIIDSTFESNLAGVEGGGIFIGGGENPGRLTMSGSTFVGNRAESGGGLYQEYTERDTNVTYVSAENCTFSGNMALSGGAIYHGGGRPYFDLSSSTITNNTAVDGGGIRGDSTRLRLLNTVLEANSGTASAPDCLGRFYSQGYNMVGNPLGCIITSMDPTDQVPGTAGLGVLSDNGGPTLTHRPDPLGLAVDHGAGPGVCPPTDQRGIVRPQATACDIGSVEVVVGNDVDEDGIPDLIDDCPGDSNKGDPGVCGCGVPETDTDLDRVPDCVDPCPGTCCPPDVPTNSDIDSDGIVDLCDNCLHVSNPDQTPVPFGQTVRATSPIRFEWTSALSWERSRGSFVTARDISGYFAGEVTVGVGTTEEITAVPPTGSGYWYLWRPDCPAGIFRPAP